jgi:Flp pilus assembly protein TadD
MFALQASHERYRRAIFTTMTIASSFLNPAVAAFFISVACFGLGSPTAAQDASGDGARTIPIGPAAQDDDSAAQDTADSPVDRLLTELAKPDQPGWQQIESAIVAEWSKSGSAAMDLLLSRGQKALSAGDHTAAIAHLTALTDHAPDFAEGWNARATAFFHAAQYGPAIADIERTLALEPRHFGALTGLAVILEKLGRPGDALAAWRRTFALNPHLDSASKAVERLGPKVDGRDI